MKMVCSLFLMYYTSVMAPRLVAMTVLSIDDEGEG